MSQDSNFYPEVLFSMVAVTLRNLEIDGDEDNYWRLIGTLVYQTADYVPELEQYLLASGAIIPDDSGSFSVNVEVLKQAFITFEEELVVQSIISSRESEEEENHTPTLQWECSEKKEEAFFRSYKKGDRKIILFLFLLKCEVFEV